MKKIILIIMFSSLTNCSDQSIFTEKKNFKSNNE